MRPWARWPPSSGWDSLKGKFVLTAGLGGMGGAQPLAITMNEGVGLIVEVDPDAGQAPPGDRLCRSGGGYAGRSHDPGRRMRRERQRPKSIGLIGNAADIYPELVARGVTPDVVTDQTPPMMCTVCALRASRV